MILGTPSENEWSNTSRLFTRISKKMPDMPIYKKRDLYDYIPTASHEAVNIMEIMLKFDPQKRPSADELLKNSYFNSIHKKY
jgi:serine/threonine protein kinase